MKLESKDYSINEYRIKTIFYLCSIILALERMYVRPFVGVCVLGVTWTIAYKSHESYHLWKRNYRGDFGRHKVERKDDLTFSYDLVESTDGFFKHKVRIRQWNDPMYIILEHKYGDLPSYVTGSPHLSFEEIESDRPIEVNIIRVPNRKEYLDDLFQAVEARHGDAPDEEFEAIVAEVKDKYRKNGPELVAHNV